VDARDSLCPALAKALAGVLVGQDVVTAATAYAGMIGLDLGRALRGPGAERTHARRRPR
jgi:hypothetical protein